MPLETVMSVSAKVPVSMASPKLTLMATGSAFVGLVSEDAIAGVGAVVSMTSVAEPEAAETLPAASVWVAVRAWVPSLSTVVSGIDQVPAATVVVGASTPSTSEVSVIVPPSSLAVPEITGVVSFVGDEGAVMAGAAGAVVSDLRKLGGDAVAVRCDVARPAEVRSMVSETLDNLGRVDILVNNAADYGGLGTHFLDMDITSLEEWNRSLAVNLTGPMLCTRGLAPLMREQGRGRVVNISAVGGFEASPYSTGYVVAKAALNHLTRCMAVALAPEVLVNCIAPGFMEETRATGLMPKHLQDSARANASLKRPINKDDVAAQVVELCRTDSTTGQTLVIDAGRVFH